MQVSIDGMVSSKRNLAVGKVNFRAYPPICPANKICADEDDDTIRATPPTGNTPRQPLFFKGAPAADAIHLLGLQSGSEQRRNGSDAIPRCSKTWLSLSAPTW
jgi:hypothetical protein